MNALKSGQLLAQGGCWFCVYSVEENVQGQRESDLNHVWHY